MTKYAALEDHLRNSGQDAVPMTFADIERVIGADLPPSAFKHRPWWSNNPSNSVITHSWLKARVQDGESGHGRKEAGVRQDCAVSAGA